MRERIGSFLKGLAFLGAGMAGEVSAEEPTQNLGAEVEQKIPTNIRTQDLPVVMPADFKLLSIERRTALAEQWVTILSEQVLSSPQALLEFKSISGENKEEIVRNVFEYSRLSANLIRGALLHFEQFLNQEQQTQLAFHANKLGERNVHVDTYATLAQWAKIMNSSKEGRSFLFLIYTDLVKNLQGKGLETLKSSSEGSTVSTTDTLTQKTSGTTEAERSKQPRLVTAGEIKEFEGKPTVALTFDDGPSRKNTPRVLAILRERGIKATFFVQGINIAPDLLKQIADDGHEIALHSWDHKNLAKNYASNPQAAFQQHVERVNDKVEQITGHRSKLFRPPEGAITAAQKNLLIQNGYWVVLWSKDTEDWNPRRNAQAKIEERAKGAQGGDIVLMHDAGGTDKDRAHSRENTIDALPGIIDELEKRGFVFTTTSQILGIESIPTSSTSVKAE